jgi:hypothetical protein
MMRNTLFLMAMATMLLLASCSSTPKKNSVSIATASSGLVKNNSIPFPLYLTDKIESRFEVEKKTANNVFIVHTGHILSASATKAQNEETLSSLVGKGVDVVNLTIEDFIIADSQDISFEKYPQQFLNSSVVDLNEDNFIKKSNINPYIIHDGVALLGLSDKRMDKKLSMEKFLVSDYVLAVLRARKSALKDPSVENNPENPLRSFVIVHTIGSDINDVMERLPPNFINSLAD